MSVYLLIFLEFFKTGLFAVGGGLATFPFLFAIAEKYGWFSVKQLADMIAVSESTPGPIGVNVATYCGFTVSGVLGAVFATLSLVLPSFIVITVIAGLLKNFSKNKTVNNFFYGLRPAVLGLIVVALSSIFEIAFVNRGAADAFSMLNPIKFAVFALILFLVLKFNKHPVLYIILGAIFGILFAF